MTYVCFVIWYLTIQPCCFKLQKDWQLGLLLSSNLTETGSLFLNSVFYCSFMFLVFIDLMNRSVRSPQGNTPASLASWPVSEIKW